MYYAQLFSALGANLESVISQSGYALLFIFALLEGIPVVGMAVPGHVAVIISGFLAKIGTLDLTSVLAVAMTGALLGDYIGFLIGRTYGLSFIDRVRRYIFVKDAHIERARALLDRHTGKAMIIGRFIPATRALLPFLVGCSRTSAGRFWFFNAIGGISWAVSSVLVGYVFGAGYHVIAAYAGRFATIAVIAAVVIVWGYRFVNIRFHIFKRYDLIVLSLNVLSLWALFGTIDMLTERSYRLTFDVWVSGIMDSFNHAHAWIIVIAEAISAVASTEVISAAAIILMLWFFLRKKWRMALITLLSIGATNVAVVVMKGFFMVERPANAVVTLANNPSFPSSHAAAAAAFFVAAAYLFSPKAKSWVKREIALVGGVIAVIAIGLARLVLNVHWASDVVAGWALGTFLSSASILFVRYSAMLLIEKKIHARSSVSK